MLQWRLNTKSVTKNISAVVSRNTKHLQSAGGQLYNGTHFQHWAQNAGGLRHIFTDKSTSHPIVSAAVATSRIKPCVSCSFPQFTMYKTSDCMSQRSLWYDLSRKCVRKECIRRGIWCHRDETGKTFNEKEHKKKILSAIHIYTQYNRNTIWNTRNVIWIHA